MLLYIDCRALNNFELSHYVRVKNADKSKSDTYDEKKENEYKQGYMQLMEIRTFLNSSSYVYHRVAGLLEPVDFSEYFTNLWIFLLFCSGTVATRG